MRYLLAALMMLGVFCDENLPAPERDVAVKSIDEPSEPVGYGAVVTPAATVENNGDSAATFDIRFYLESPADGVGYEDSLIGRTLAAGQSEQLDFRPSDPLVVAGAWTARCVVAFTGDLDTTNNTLTRTFEVGARKDVVDLIPADNEIGGWSRSGAMRIAENETQLYELIDGEGVVYVENGFVKCAFQNYLGQLSGNDVELELRVFDMGGEANAAAVYAATATGAETPWTGDNPGTEARIDEGLLFDYKVEFRADRFFVWITIREKSDPALGIAKLFAHNVDGAIGG